MIVKSKNSKFDVKLCDTMPCHYVGLMFNIPKNDGLLFKFKKEKFVSLHMLFVFITIDIIYLDKEKQIIKILKRVKPFTPFIKSVKCKYILELKNAKTLRLNDKLSFKD